MLNLKEDEMSVELPHKDMILEATIGGLAYTYSYEERSYTDLSGNYLYIDNKRVTRLFHWSELNSEFLVHVDGRLMYIPYVISSSGKISSRFPIIKPKDVMPEVSKKAVEILSNN